MGEPMAHHVLSPWTLGEDDNWEHSDTGVRFAASGTPCRVLVDVDLLDPRVPPRFLASLLALIESGPRVTWLLWTRWPDLFRPALESSDCEETSQAGLWLDHGCPPANVWLGVRAETQAECDARIPELLAIPAALRWLWLDPLAESVSLSRAEACNCMVPMWEGAGQHSPACAVFKLRLGWVVAQGGESPVHPAWVRSLRDQCSEAGVPFRFGGWGEWAPANDGAGCDLHGLQGDGGFFDYCDRWNALGQNPFRQSMCRVGAEASGRLLDGRTHDDVPESREVPRG